MPVRGKTLNVNSSVNPTKFIIPYMETDKIVPYVKDQNRDFDHHSTAAAHT